MVIDDDKVNNFICTKIIEKSGLADNVITCQSAEEGLTHLRNALVGQGAVPELIFLDLNMPVMSGWDFLEEYKNSFGEIAPNVTLVVLSSSVYHEDINRAKSYVEVSEYMSKPITLDMLSIIDGQYFNN